MKGKLEFPKNFLWGASTSSHQVEGDNFLNDWWQWEEAGRFSEISGKACNQYELYEEDFKLAHSLRHNAHRFSLEWSRIEPREGQFDEEALRHYRNVISALQSLGVAPVVTLNHFTLPAWFQERGGWTAGEAAAVFSRYTERAVRALGKDVTYWLTVNEPVGNIHGAFIDGKWPPGKRSLKEAARAFVNILKSHCLAYRVIHDIYGKAGWPVSPPKVSLAKFTVKYSPCRKDTLADRLSSDLRHYYVNKLLIESLIKGYCIAPGIPPVKLPGKGALDFIGLNYYTRDYVHSRPFFKSGIFGEICSQRHHRDSGKRNAMGWEIHPRGLYELLKEFAKYGLPILITENGICAADDNERIDFIKDHLAELHRAMREGAPVIGYMYWSLLDNFEWAHGYGPRFGLVEVDYSTQRRTVRPSARIYADIISRNSL